MHIQVINFHLKDLSEADYVQACAEIAPAFAEVPGLLSKVWLANPDTNTYGGVYTWESRAAMEEYRKSELATAAATNPHFVGITATDFDVVEDLTRVTRGLPTVPA